MTSSGAYDSAVTPMLAALTAARDGKEVTADGIRTGLGKINDPKGQVIRPTVADFAVAGKVGRERRAWSTTRAGSTPSTGMRAATCSRRWYTGRSRIAASSNTSSTPVRGTSRTVRACDRRDRAHQAPNPPFREGTARARVGNGPSGPLAKSGKFAMFPLVR